LKSELENEAETARENWRKRTKSITGRFSGKNMRENELDKLKPHWKPVNEEPKKQEAKINKNTNHFSRYEADGKANE